MALLGLLAGAAGGCATLGYPPDPVAPPTEAPPPPAASAGTAQARPQSWPLALGAGYYVEDGVASFYGRKHHGKRTASGERFDMHALTAAHRQLPLGSVVRVTHLRTGRQVVVRVNDRGPYGRRKKPGPNGEPVGAYKRHLDLSMGAAKVLDFIKAGSAPVRIELLALPAALPRKARR